MYYRITFSHVFTWLPNSNKGLLRAVLLTMVCVIAASWFPTTAQAAVSTVALGCRASATGGNLSIPINSSVGEGATIVVAIQVVARNEDITSVSDLGVGGNTYTRLVKHLGIVIGPVGNQENDTLHMYAAFDAKALNSGQPINIVWNFSNGLEACAVAVYGLQRTPFDKSAASHASSASPNSGNTATTALAKTYGPTLTSFCSFLSFSQYNDKIILKFQCKWKKGRWCAWDSNPVPEDVRHRRSYMFH